MWRVFIIHVWLRAFGDAFSKTWMFENTPLFFSAREIGESVARKRRVRYKMTDADLEHFAQLVGGSVDYCNAHEVIVRMRKGCKLYLRLNAKAPYGCHLALSAERLGAGLSAVRKKVQMGLKGWSANGRIDVDYNLHNRSTKFGNAVRFTPTANPAVLLSDSVYYVAVLALEVTEKLGNLGAL